MVAGVVDGWGSAGKVPLSILCMRGRLEERPPAHVQR